MRCVSDEHNLVRCPCLDPWVFRLCPQVEVLGVECSQDLGELCLVVWKGLYELRFN
jgi:hypothetical protein